MKSPEMGRDKSQNPVDLLIKNPDKTINYDIETGKVQGMLSTESVGTIVEMVLNEPDQEKRIARGKEIIDACIRAGIVEPSVWNEKLDYPADGHEDGFSFKWVNHYEGDPEEIGSGQFVLRYEGWREVSQNLHVLTQEVPELKEYAQSRIKQS